MKTVILRIDEKTPQGYPLTLSIDAAAPVQGLLPADLGVDDPPRFDGAPLTAERARRIFLEEDSGEGLVETGCFLYRLLHQGDLGAAWEEVRREVGCTVLDVRPAELRALPWELLRHPTARDWLFLDPRHAIVRGELVHERRPCEWPVRLLVVVGCDPNDTKIRWREEVEGIEAARRQFGPRLEYRRLDQPGKTALGNAIEKFEPHLFHFIGHGHFSGDGEDGVLDLFTPERTEQWTVEDIHPLLKTWSPHFVFLNACRSGDQPPAGDGSWALHQPFVRNRACAVLGMQGDVDGEFATRFSARLYRELADGKELPHAVVAARREVQAIGRLGFGHRAWSMPSLLVSVPVCHLMEVDPPLDRDLEESIAVMDEFRAHRDFVNRTEETRRVWRRAALEDGREPTDLLILSGEERVGKTALALVCSRICTLRGHAVRYLNFRGDRSYGWLDVLEAIRSGRPGCTLRPLPDDAFREFDEHAAILRRPPGAGEDPAGLGAVDEQVEERVFQLFLQGLQDAAGGEPLVVVLDHLGVFKPDAGIVEDDWRQYLLPRLVEPFARRRVTPVKLVLVAGEDLDDLGLERVNADKIELEPFGEEEFRTYALELFLFANEDRTAVEPIVDGLAASPRLTQKWTFAKLKTLRDALV